MEHGGGRGGEACLTVSAEICELLLQTFCRYIRGWSLNGDILQGSMATVDIPSLPGEEKGTHKYEDVEPSSHQSTTVDNSSGVV